MIDEYFTFFKLHKKMMNIVIAIAIHQIMIKVIVNIVIVTALKIANWINK